jgi:hypothetical protein
MNKQLIEIASWRMVSELQRRYPGMFRVIETHPGCGTYDCLSLINKQGKAIADFNRSGRFHVLHGSKEKPLEIWKEISDNSDSKKILDKVCQMLGWQTVKKLPSSTSTTLVYRFIADFLAHAAFGIHAWECRNGYCDTSGYGGGVVSDFEEFPKAKEGLEIIQADDLLKQPAYRFWFLRKDNAPKICLKTDGFLWMQDDQNTYNLMELYKQKDRRIWPVIVAVANRLLS